MKKLTSGVWMCEFKQSVPDQLLQPYSLKKETGQ